MIERKAILYASVVAVFAMLLVGCAVVQMDEESDADTISGALVTLSFNENITEASGGSSGTTNQYLVLRGNSVELPTMEFTRTGYYLIGWALNSPDGQVYATGVEFTVETNTTFYAIWKEPRGTHYEKLDMTLGIDEPYEGYIQSGDFGIGDIANYGFTEGCELPEGIFATEDDPMMSSWNTIIVAGSPTTPGLYYVEFHFNKVGIGEDTYIYWCITVPSEMDKDITITYDLDGGTGTAPAETTRPGGTAIVLPEQGISTKSGYNLVGWAGDDGRGTQVVYALGSVYTVHSFVGDDTLTAFWVDEPNVLILNAFGAEGVEGYVIYNGSTFTLPSAEDREFEKSGYTLEGWYLMDSPDAIYSVGYIYPTNGQAINLVGYWVEEGAATYQVEFRSNGGDDAQLVQNVIPGDYVVTPSTGFVNGQDTLVSWNTEPDGSGTSIIPGQRFLPQGDDILYAQYSTGGSSTGTYTVTFDTNGGVGSVSQQTVNAGDTVSAPMNPPTRERHILEGWRSTGSSALWDFNNMGVNSNLILVASWIEHFTVTMNDSNVTLRITDTMSSRGLSEIQWGDGDTDTDITRTATHFYDDEGEFTITVTTADNYTSEYTITIEDSGGGNDNPGEDGETPDVSAAIHVDGSSATLEATVDSGYSEMTWTINGKDMGSDNPLELSGLEDGHYDVTLSVSYPGLDEPVTWEGSFDIGDGTNWTLIVCVVLVILIAIVIVGRHLL